LINIELRGVFEATGEFSSFPTDNGDDTYYIRSWNYERMKLGDTYTFESEVNVFIPAGYSERIYKAPHQEYDIKIDERYLGGNQTYDLWFVVEYLGKHSGKYMVREI